MKRASALLLLLVVGCGGARLASETAATEVARPSGRVGEYVVYRFSGERIGRDSRVLMKEIVLDEGGHLPIDVTLQEGRTVVRRWQETLEDTHGPIATEHVLALCEYEGETCVPRANEGNADLVRLYEGLRAIPDVPPPAPTTEDAEHTIGGVVMRCRVSTAEAVLAGAPVTATELECPDFAWPRAGYALVDAEKLDVFQIAIEAAGSGG